MNDAFQVRYSVSSEKISIDICETSLGASETEETSETTSMPESSRHKVGIISSCVSATCAESPCTEGLCSYIGTSIVAVTLDEGNVKLETIPSNCSCSTHIVHHYDEFQSSFFKKKNTRQDSSFGFYP